MSAGRDSRYSDKAEGFTLARPDKALSRLTRRRVALVLRALIRLPIPLRVADTARHPDPTLRPECRQTPLPDVATKTSADGANRPAGRLDMSLRSPASSTFDE